MDIVPQSPDESGWNFDQWITVLALGDHDITDEFLLREVAGKVKRRDFSQFSSHTPNTLTLSLKARCGALTRGGEGMREIPSTYTTGWVGAVA